MTTTKVNLHRNYFKWKNYDKWESVSNRGVARRVWNPLRKNLILVSNINLGDVIYERPQVI